MPSIQRHLHTLYQEGATFTCLWVPGHVGVLDNERADEDVRLGGADNYVTFDLVRSLSTIKTSINSAAIRASRWILEDVVAQGSRSTTWYSTAAGQRSHQSMLSPHIPPNVLINLIRLRLGYTNVQCRSAIMPLNDADTAWKSPRSLSSTMSYNVRLPQPSIVMLPRHCNPQTSERSTIAAKL